jgi:hypothetical protein
LEGTYFNPRDTVKPPAMLLKKVFPKVEEGLTSIRKDPSSLDKKLCEVGFLRLMDFLRTVFPQDAALLQRCYPEHELFKAGLFVHNRSRIMDTSGVIGDAGGHEAGVEY